MSGPEYEAASGSLKYIIYILKTRIPWVSLLLGIGYQQVGKEKSGPGLFQVYGTIRRADGFVDVESKPGQGACFTLGVSCP